MTRLPTLGLAAASLLLLAAPASAHTPPQAAPAAPSATGCPEDVRQNATRELIEFTSDGHAIHALIYKPRYHNGAAVVLLPGALGFGGDAQRFDPHAIQLASRGYVVLVANYFDARPFRARRTGVDMAAWARVGADAVRFVGGQPNVDPRRVALWGYSYGGFLATDGSVVPDAPAAVAIGLETGTDIWSEPSRGRREMPVLLMHGRADTAVSPSSMRSLAANLRLRGATVDIQMLDSGQHDLNPAAWCEAFRLTRGFLDANLLVEGAPPVPTTPAG
ncbi:alpha/beta hydrolase family protein [Brevundimonas sp.]|uniref:alpha/beta hydrolase family protein n=1 Tax=Brevundimonas sp. TaxID=1871086 RepID=UPI0035656EC0